LFLSYLADFVSAALVMITLKLLSTHATGEQTLDLPNHFLQVCWQALGFITEHWGS